MKKLISLLVIVCAILFASTSANAQVPKVDIVVITYGANTPTANLTVSPNDTACIGAALTFQSPAQAGCTFQFLLDGASVQGPAGSNININTTAGVGNHRMIVIVDNGSCAARDTVDFVIQALPTPTLTCSAPANTACAGASVTYTIAGGGTNNNFQRNGASVQTGASTTFTTSSLNNGDIITCVVTNAGGCSATSNAITMTINPSPVVTMTSSDADNTICPDDSVTFTITSPGATSFTFRLNGAIVSSGPSNTYVTPNLTNGNIIIGEATNAGGCTSSSTPITMTVRPRPGLTSSTGNTALTAVCVNNMVNVSLVGLTGTPPYSFRIYNDNAGSFGTLYYTVPGTLVGPNGTISYPQPVVGPIPSHILIIDANGCKNY